jgi:CspA family cold shock protein
MRYGLGSQGDFGFIQPAQGGADIFVHRSKLAQGVTTLKQGDHVRYHKVKGPKGWQAHDVQVMQ